MAEILTDYRLGAWAGVDASSKAAWSS